MLTISENVAMTGVFSMKCMWTSSESARGVSGVAFTALADSSAVVFVKSSLAKNVQKSKNVTMQRSVSAVIFAIFCF